MIKLVLVVTCLLCVSQAFSSIIDVFEATNGHEPRVAINCGRVPFYIDLETGAWIADSEGVSRCEKDKEEVKSYCQMKYPKLNITNVVEANKPVKFNNWCEPGHEQCNDAKKVVPFRCLVNEYEADALMVPDGCKFDHVHDQEKCLSHDDWKIEATKECKRKYSMKLVDYGILLSCKTDYFTGVEFVCCPKKSHKKKHHKKHHKAHHKNKKIYRQQFSAAIKNFQKYLPLETEGCDRSTYIKKQTAMEDHHRDQIAAVVDEWDEAEKRYSELKLKDPISAEEKMKRTLEAFRETLAALEQESKDEKARLRHEHADCINTQIAKNKRDAMVSYLGAIEEQPVNAEKILKTVRKFIQVCEHDRVHSLRHFEHVRNRDAEKAETLRGELLQHLKDLNKIVNESMSLMNYLPEIADQFGITGGVVLKPRLEVPVDEHSAHHHKRVKEILDSHYEPSPTTGSRVPTDDIPAESVNEISTVEYTDDADDEDEDDDDDEDNSVESTGKKQTLKEKKHGKHHSRGSRSPFAFNAVMGLSCGVLVIMMFLVIAMVVRRRRRLITTRVVLAENNDEREHLVEMQKNGFENPTYKFFYY